MNIRESVERYGVLSVPTDSLLTYVLQPRKSRESLVLDTMARIPLEELISRDVFELEFAYQLTHREASILSSIGQIVARFKVSHNERVSITAPDKAAEILLPQMQYLEQEHFVVLCLDTKNHIKFQTTVSIGTADMSIAHPREVFKAAIRCSSSSVLLAHNHPSGIVTPSSEDLQLTQQLVQAGKIVGIEVVDHIIIGNNQWISLREKGLM